MRLLLLLFGTPLGLLTAQTTDTLPHRLSVRATVDAYYAYHSTDAGDPFSPYLSAGPRAGQFGLNLAQAGFDYRFRRWRAAFTYQTGDIPASSWSGAFPNVQEANAGYRLADELWIDAGFFLTHIGFESILPQQKYLSSTAYLSWNEPFFQSGLRLSYSPGDRVTLQGWLLNGYNSFVDNNEAKSVGLSLSYTPTDATLLSYNNLFGDEAPRGTDRRQFRSVNNLYWRQQWTGSFLSVLNYSLFTQGNSDPERPEEGSTASGAFLTLRYALTDRWSLTARGEYFRDEHGIISGQVPTPDPDATAGLDVTGYTLSLEYRPTDRTYFRAAGRLGGQADEIALFRREGSRVNERLEILLTTGVALQRAFNY